MANRTLFSRGTRLRRADAVNNAGGRAYQLGPKHALAQMAATGVFNHTFYVRAHTQPGELMKLVVQVQDNEFLAKLAVYARERACMKDMPAALLLALSRRDTELTHRVFSRVVNSGRVLRTTFQMARSGHFGRVSLSSSLQRAFRQWLNDASVTRLLSASIGNDPSLRDVLRMARPKPKDDARRALFGWLTGSDLPKWAPATAADLPEQVRLLEEYRRAETQEAQSTLLSDLAVRWDLLADAARGPLTWKAIARTMGPQALRMNLNTLRRQKVFETPSGSADVEMIDYVAGRLADPDEVLRSRQFPYQFLAAYLNADSNVPQKIRTALHRAAEISCGSIPELPGPIVIGVDASGSMSWPVTGWQGRGANSKVRCVDVAAVFAAAMLRRNPDSIVVPYDTRAFNVRVDPGDTILSIAERLARFGGGGTDSSVPLREADKRHRNSRFAGVVLISDNESWVNTRRGFSRGATGVLAEWQAFLKNQKRLDPAASPKLVCIDIQPGQTTQAPERDDILNVGGFSDAVFNVVSAFIDGDAGRFVAEVESVKL